MNVWGLNQSNGAVDSEKGKHRRAKKEIEAIRLGEWLDTVNKKSDDSSELPQKCSVYL